MGTPIGETHQIIHVNPQDYIRTVLFQDFPVELLEVFYTKPEGYHHHIGGDPATIVYGGKLSISLYKHIFNWRLDCYKQAKIVTFPDPKDLQDKNALLVAQFDMLKVAETLGATHVEDHIKERIYELTTFQHPSGRNIVLTFTSPDLQLHRWRVARSVALALREGRADDMEHLSQLRCEIPQFEAHVMGQLNIEPPVTDVHADP